MADFNNAQVAALPKHLQQYVVNQNYSKYTAIDQAVWRYVMRQNYSYLKDVAYYPYIPGLKKAGLSIERIPDLQEMNDALGKIGWGAVTVDGFIPPVAFMEYQKYRVLVVAADIRQLHHIEYTPAPDIIHESAGHAPIIGDEDYAKYLSYFGSIGAKAMFSYQDFLLYEAIRKLSILKEMPDAALEDIQAAEDALDFQSKNMGELSEMALLSRLHWWTVEYGLIGSLEDPKIYGAGLLSSIGESDSCMRAEVKKLPYTIDAVKQSYDITKPQPQLFVTPTFQNLIDVLEQFADTMSFRVGGSHGLSKAIDCKNVCTAVYSSGLQVTGVFSEFLDKNNALYFIKTNSPSALSINDTQLENHGKDYHAHGFSSPVGKLKNVATPIEDLDNNALKINGILVGKPCVLSFESGIVVSGFLKNILTQNNKNQLFTFQDCTVTDNNTNKILFEPAWGMYDMAVGEVITSVFCGSADKDAFEELSLVSTTTTHQVTYTDKALALQSIYQNIRSVRENKLSIDALKASWSMLKLEFVHDYLAAIELLELIVDKDITWATEVRAHLLLLAKTQPEHHKLINDGLHIIDFPIVDHRMAVGV